MRHILPYDNSHNFSLKWPILVIFWANMVNSHVPICPMMTKSLYMTILVGRIGLKDDYSTDTIRDCVQRSTTLFGPFLTPPPPSLQFDHVGYTPPLKCRCKLSTKGEGLLPTYNDI